MYFKNVVRVFGLLVALFLFFLCPKAVRARERVILSIKELSELSDVIIIGEFINSEKIKIQNFEYSFTVFKMIKILKNQADFKFDPSLEYITLLHERDKSITPIVKGEPKYSQKKEYVLFIGGIMYDGLYTFSEYGQWQRDIEATIDNIKEIEKIVNEQSKSKKETLRAEKQQDEPTIEELCKDSDVVVVGKFVKAKKIEVIKDYEYTIAIFEKKKLWKAKPTGLLTDHYSIKGEKIINLEDRTFINLLIQSKSPIQSGVNPEYEKKKEYILFIKEKEFFKGLFVRSSKDLYSGAKIATKDRINEVEKILKNSGE